jgi:uncharacterized membrane protein
VTETSPVSDHRIERILAYLVASAVVLSILAFVAVIVGTAVGVRDFDEGLWPTVIMLPLLGLPIGFVLMIALLVVSAVRRGRETKDARG